jgi:hypothetical protein
MTVEQLEALATLLRQESITRERVVREAQEWIGTPFIHEARVKGVGADCAQFLIGVYSRAGILDPFDVPHHPIQWHLHPDAPGFDKDLYIRELQRYAREISAPPLPGDIAVFWWGHAYAHSAIVIVWPTKLIHCFEMGGVQVVDGARDPYARKYRSNHPPRFFSLFRME